jgi:hypothetical protein
VDELNAAGGVVVTGVTHRVVLVGKSTPVMEKPMCQFITGVLPSEGRLPHAHDALTRMGRRLVSVDNEAVRHQLLPNEAYYALSAGGCDCGAALGRIAMDRAGRERDDTAKARKLAARGWSAAKVERALASRVRAREDAERAAADEIAQWTALLLRHFYHGDLHDEPLVIRRRVVVVGPDAPGALESMDEDTLVEFRSG